MARCFSRPNPEQDEKYICLNDNQASVGLIDISGDRAAAYMHIDDGVAAASSNSTSQEVGEACADSCRSGGYLIKRVVSPKESVGGKY